jgi:hypothetical protein
MVNLSLTILHYLDLVIKTTEDKTFSLSYFGLILRSTIESFYTATSPVV